MYTACYWHLISLLLIHSIYEKLIAFCNLDELGTNYPQVRPHNTLLYMYGVNPFTPKFKKSTKNVQVRWLELVEWAE